jgi:hypothetical protein
MLAVPYLPTRIHSFSNAAAVLGVYAAAPLFRASVAVLTVAVVVSNDDGDGDGEDEPITEARARSTCCARWR